MKYKIEITNKNIFFFFFLVTFVLDLTVAFQGVCDSDTHKECLRAGINYNKRTGGETLGPVKSDPKDEVCGNNGRIYKNIHELRCRAKYDKSNSFIYINIKFYEHNN